jgi:uracil-DNA glycosylase
MNILHEIEACQRCIRLRIPDRLYTSEKPYVKFQVEQHWKPEDGNIKVLFIAESPPWSGKQSYFYNPNTLEKSSGLRKGVFKYLKIKSLEEFRGEGYFLIDAIKCRLNKKKSNTNVSKEVSKTCSEQFLEREIRELKTKTIFVLGNSAKKAL